jgi:ABC-type lipoprotein release transport system permease subunit
MARLAWRNLWRNRRRTWLTAGGVGFAVWLLVFAMSMQDGSFEVMVDNAARLLTGHVQLQHPAYQDDPSIEHWLAGAPALRAQAVAASGVVAALPRAAAFGLVSVGERSLGVQVMGVSPQDEAAASTLPAATVAGRYLDGSPAQAYLGAMLARNLGATVGDELVILGAALEGGVAASTATVVGLFETGQPALDRALLQIPIDDFRAAWNLPPDAVHSLVLILDRAGRAAPVAAALDGPGRAALDWQALLPEARQTVELKRVGAQLFFVMVALIVTFSVVNTFMMTVFERTPELGMLMALGMRRGAVATELCIEAWWLGLLGVMLGLAAAAATVAVLSQVGIPLPADAAELLVRYNLPDRMYPSFSLPAAVVAVVVMLVGVQIAVAVPAWRIRRLRPVQALRALA